MKIGLVQMAMAESREENLAKASSAVRELAKQGADIVCLPELFLSRYFCQEKDDRFFELAHAIPGPDTEALGALAREARTTLIASLFEKAGDKYFNTAVIIGPEGTLLGKYRKIHIPDDPEHGYGESYYFAPGDLGVQVFKTESATVAPMICWDQWFPEGARAAALGGAQILFYPTAIGWHTGDPTGIREAEHEAWQTIQKSHSIANNVFMVAVNRVGVEGDLTFWGTSFVADPYGRFIAKASTDTEENLIVELDLELISAMRKDWPFLASRKL